MVFNKWKGLFGRRYELFVYLIEVHHVRCYPVDREKRPVGRWWLCEEKMHA